MEQDIGGIVASVGYLYSKSGATTEYRNDGRLNLDCNAFALGLAYKLSDAVEINFGGTTSIFLEEENTLPSLNNSLIPRETYNAVNYVFAVGVNYSL